MKKDFSTKKLLEEIIDETVSTVFSEEFIGNLGGVNLYQMGGSIKRPELYNLDSKGKPTRDPGVAGLKKSSKKKAKKKHSKIVGESRAAVISLLAEFVAQEMFDNSLNEATEKNTPSAKRGEMPGFGGKNISASKAAVEFKTPQEVFEKLKELVKNEAAVKEAFNDASSSLRPTIKGIANFFDDVPVKERYKGEDENRYFEDKSRFMEKVGTLFNLLKNNTKASQLTEEIVQFFIDGQEYEALSLIIPLFQGRDQTEINAAIDKAAAEKASSKSKLGVHTKKTQAVDINKDYSTFFQNVQKSKENIERMITDTAVDLGSNEKSIRSFFANTLSQALGKKKTDINAEFVKALKTAQSDKDASLKDRADIVVNALEASLSNLPKAKTEVGKKAIEDLVKKVRSSLAAPEPKVFKKPTIESKIYNHLFTVDRTNNAFACALLLFALSE